MRVDTARDPRTNQKPTKPVDLDALEKLHAQSSPGDWKAIDREDSTTFVMRGDPRSDHWAFDVCADGRDIEVLLLEFYNAAHNSLPVLIAELREARELLRALDALLKNTELSGYVALTRPGSQLRIDYKRALAAAREWEKVNG